MIKPAKVVSILNIHTIALAVIGFIAFAALNLSIFLPLFYQKQPDLGGVQNQIEEILNSTNYLNGNTLESLSVLNETIHTSFLSRLGNIDLFSSYLNESINDVLDTVSSLNDSINDFSDTLDYLNESIISVSDSVTYLTEVSSGLSSTEYGNVTLTISATGLFTGSYERVCKYTRFNDFVIFQLPNFIAQTYTSGLVTSIITATGLPSTIAPGGLRQPIIVYDSNSPVAGGISITPLSMTFYVGTTPGNKFGQSGAGAVGFVPTSLSWQIGIESFGVRVPGGAFWVLDGTTILGSLTNQTILLQHLSDTKMTDIYLYLAISSIIAYTTELRLFIPILLQQGVNTWIWDGSRGFFTDVDGPGELITSINAVIDYNAGCSNDSQKIYGYHADLEPHDQIVGGILRVKWNNGIAQSALNSTQASDRQFICHDWLSIMTTAKNLLSPVGLKLSIAMIHYTDNIGGEPVPCTFQNVTKLVFEHMLDIVDRMDVMGYSTSPPSAYNRILGELSYADYKWSVNGTGPLVYCSIQVNSVGTFGGDGSGITYADTSGKNSKQVVKNDLSTLRSLGSGHPGFGGCNAYTSRGYFLLPA
jgi:hypothetical protein